MTESSLANPSRQARDELSARSIPTLSEPEPKARGELSGGMTESNLANPSRQARDELSARPVVSLNETDR